jgi:hypothetical protein
MKHFRYAAALPLCVLLLGTVACTRQEDQKSGVGSAAPQRAATEPVAIKACALITKADVAELAGITAKEVKEGMSSPMVSQCTFTAEDVTTVDVMIKRSPVRYDVDSEMAGMKKGMPGVPFREAAGIGDRAFYMGGQLNVYRGDLYVLISMLGFPPGPKTDEAAQKLAQKVLSQL